MTSADARIDCVLDALADADLGALRQGLAASVARNRDTFIGADGELTPFGALILWELLSVSCAPGLTREGRSVRAMEALVFSGAL